MPRVRPMLRDLRIRAGFAGLLGATTALGIAHSFVTPYLSLWATQQVELTAREFGGFMTVGALCAILAGTLVARWSDLRLARRTTLTLGAICGVCGYLGYAWTNSPPLLVILAATAVALSTTCFPQLFAHVRETFDPPEAGAAHGALLVSLIRVCFSVAWTAGPAVAAVVVQQAGYRGLFLAAALLYTVFLLGVRRFVPYRKPTPHPIAHQPVWRTLGRGDILAAFLAFAAVFAAHAVNLMNLPLLITRELGGSARDVGLAFGIGPLVEIPLMLWFGHLAGRGHLRRLIQIGAAVTVAYFALLGLATRPWHVFPVQVLSGVSFAILTNVAILYFQDLLPEQRGLGTALFANAGNAGNLAGFLGFALLIEALGHRHLYGPCTALAVLTLVILVCVRPRTAPPPMPRA